MKRRNALVLVFVALIMVGIDNVNPAVASEDSWTSKAPMHVARSGLGVAVVNGKVYAIGGSTESGTNVNLGGFVGTNEEYDPETDIWTYKKPMPTPRSYFSIASYEGKIYCIGGITGYNKSAGEFLMTKVNEVYDSATGTWLEKASLSSARYSAIATTVGSRIFLFGGRPDLRLSEVYDIETDSWTTLSPIPISVTGYTSGSVFVDGKILVIDYFSQLQIYDPKTDTWEIGASPPLHIYGGDAAATIGAFTLKRAYFFGNIGLMDQGAMPNRVYDPKTESWTLGAKVPTNRMNFGVAVVDDILYVIGGRSQSFPFPADFPFVITQSAANEAYTPADYGTPDPDYEPPAPSPSPTPSPSPSLSPSPTPTPSPTTPATPIPTITESPSPSASPTPTASGKQPASSPNPQQAPFQIELVYAAAAAAAIGAGAAVTVLAKRKRRQP